MIISIGSFLCLFPFPTFQSWRHSSTLVRPRPSPWSHAHASQTGTRQRREKKTGRPHARQAVPACPGPYHSVFIFLIPHTHTTDTHQKLPSRTHSTVQYSSYTTLHNTENTDNQSIPVPPIIIQSFDLLIIPWGDQNKSKSPPNLPQLLSIPYLYTTLPYFLSLRLYGENRGKHSYHVISIVFGGVWEKKKRNKLSIQCYSKLRELEHPGNSRACIRALVAARGQGASAQITKHTHTGVFLAGGPPIQLS
jgi:hypothetical protein